MHILFERVVGQTGPKSFCCRVAMVVNNAFKKYKRRLESKILQNNAILKFQCSDM